MFTVILNSKMADSSDGDSKLIVGHEGAGDDCIGKIIDKTGKFFLAGGAIGATEGCFLTPIPGNTTPLIFRCLALMLQRSILLGTVGGVYAGGVCTAASLRDKDDYRNAVFGGALAGSIFGLKTRSIPIGLGLAAGLAGLMGAIKFRTNQYYPTPFPIPHGRDLAGNDPLVEPSNSEENSS